MASWAIEVGTRRAYVDAEGEQVTQDVADLGVTVPVDARASRMYWLAGDLAESDVEKLATHLLTDPVLQEFRIDADLLGGEPGHAAWIAEVRLRPGVTDPVGDSVIKGAQDLQVAGLSSTSTGRRVYLSGRIDEPTARRICERLLVNDVVQTYDLRDTD